MDFLPIIQAAKFNFFIARTTVIDFFELIFAKINYGRSGIARLKERARRLARGAISL